METEQKNKRGIAFAILAAALYAINAPFSKILLEFMPPTLMAGFLYVGAGIGMIFIALMRKIKKYEAKELKLTKSELPYTIAMIVLDIAAPICLLFGLNSTTAANASLLNNFEIVATAIIALMVFKEKISTRLWFGIFFVTCVSHMVLYLFYLPPFVGDLRIITLEKYRQKIHCRLFC